MFNPIDYVKPSMPHRTLVKLVSALIVGALALPPLCAGAEPDRRYTLAEAIGWETLLMPGGNMEPAIRLNETLLVDVRARQTRRRNDERLDEPGVDLSGLSRLTANAMEVTVPAGHVYLLGDKRGNSNDSRFNGPVPLDAVRGVVRFAGPASLQGPFRALGPPTDR